MKKWEKESLLPIATLLLLLSVPIYVAISMESKTRSIRTRFESMGYDVTSNVKIESPPLIRECTFTEFCEVVEQLDPSEIFIDNWNFYVFSDDMLTAYRYYVSVGSTIFGIK